MEIARTNFHLQKLREIMLHYWRKCIAREYSCCKRGGNKDTGGGWERAISELTIFNLDGSKTIKDSCKIRFFSSSNCLIISDAELYSNMKGINIDFDPFA